MRGLLASVEGGRFEKIFTLRDILYLAVEQSSRGAQQSFAL